MYIRSMTFDSSSLLMYGDGVPWACSWVPLSVATRPLPGIQSIVTMSPFLILGSEL